MKNKCGNSRMLWQNWAGRIFQNSLKFFGLILADNEKETAFFTFYNFVEGLT
jgi:hypothetical protein